MDEKTLTLFRPCIFRSLYMPKVVEGGWMLRLSSLLMLPLS
jgi:hypothetical protein